MEDVNFSNIIIPRKHILKTIKDIKKLINFVNSMNVSLIIGKVRAPVDNI